MGPQAECTRHYQWDRWVQEESLGHAPSVLENSKGLWQLPNKGPWGKEVNIKKGGRKDRVEPGFQDFYVLY